MRGMNGILLLAVGLVLLWLAVSGRLTNAAAAWAALTGKPVPKPVAGPSSSPGVPVAPGAPPAVAPSTAMWPRIPGTPMLSPLDLSSFRSGLS
jgi:hypothetical protein